MNQSHTEPRYRWVIVVISALLLGGGVGLIANGISVFFDPLNKEFGWKRGSVSLIYFFGIIGLALGGILMGRIADRIETRWVSLFGVIVMGLSLIAASRADQLWQFYLCFFVAGFLGAGALFAPLVANVGNWFTTHVGLALGITSAGQALGQGGVPYGAALLIGAIGWRDALFTMGLVALIVLLPLALLIRQPTKRAAGAMLDGSDSDDISPVPLSNNTVVIWMSLAVVLCCICMSVPLIHLVPMIQDHGVPLDQAASVLFVMLMVAVLGRIAFGRLADMIGAIPAYFTASFWQTLMVFFFIQMESLSSFYIFAVIYGFGYAGVMTGIIICMRTLTPLARRAGSLGIVTTFGWLGHGIGGYQGGFFYDLMGSYTLPYANAAMAGVLNLIVVAALYMTIRQRRSRVQEMAAV